MPKTLAPPLSPETIEQAQKDYEEALPRITEHAEIKFRHLRGANLDDAIANTLGLGWKHWLAAIRQGKNPNEFVSSIAEFAVRQTCSGRRVDGIERAKDVMSPRAQKHKGFAVEPLPVSTCLPHDVLYGDPHGQEKVDAIEDRLQDNTRTPPPEQAAFREHWRIFLDNIGPKKRPIIQDMAAGADTKDLAATHKVSPGRISQIRREAQQAWQSIDPEVQER